MTGGRLLLLIVLSDSSYPASGERVGDNFNIMTTRALYATG